MEHADDPQPNGSTPGVSRPLLGALEDASLDLVMAAAEGDDALVRDLLRAAVALGLTSAVGYWKQTTNGQGWTQVRGFGGPTESPASLSGAPASQGSGHGAGEDWTGRQLEWTLGATGAVVAARETFDRDGLRSEREDSLASLVILAETLMVDDGITPGALPQPESPPRFDTPDDDTDGPRRAG